MANKVKRILLQKAESYPYIKTDNPVLPVAPISAYILEYYIEEQVTGVKREALVQKLKSCYTCNLKL